LQEGSVSAPAFSFANDNDTGVYNSAANTLAFTTGGAQRATFTSSGLTLANSGQFLALGGTVSVPGYSFSGDANVGIWRPSADVMAFSTNLVAALALA
jgi:hypothetical protein